MYLQCSGHQTGDKVFPFPLDALVITSAASEALPRGDVAHGLGRHAAGLWGDYSDTRLLIEGVVDEDSYRQSKEELIVEKTRLKQEKQRLCGSRENSWIEPARKVVIALQTLGKNDVSEHPSEISGLVQKIGTNRLISRKNVSFSISAPYDFPLSLLANMHLELSHNPSLHADKNWWSTEMVRERGLEPPPLSGPDPKSGVSAIPPLAQRAEALLPRISLIARKFGGQGSLVVLVRSC